MKKLGLVVGIDTYADEKHTLQFARSDAEKIYEVMVDPDCGGFDPENVITTYDGEATMFGLQRAFTDLGKMAKKCVVGEEIQLWVYFAGHAIEKDEAIYWATAEMDADGNGALKSDELMDKISKVKADTLVLILDCCHGGGIADADGISYRSGSHNSGEYTVRDLQTKLQNHGGSSTKAQIYITPSDNRYRAIEAQKFGGGLLTMAVVEGLKGKADRVNAGYVTSGGLRDYVLHHYNEFYSTNVQGLREPYFQFKGANPTKVQLTFNRTLIEKDKKQQELIDDILNDISSRNYLTTLSDLHLAWIKSYLDLDKARNKRADIPKPAREVLDVVYEISNLRKKGDFGAADYGEKLLKRFVLPSRFDLPGQAGDSQNLDKSTVINEIAETEIPVSLPQNQPKKTSIATKHWREDARVEYEHIQDPDLRDLAGKVLELVDKQSYDSSQDFITSHASDERLYLSLFALAADQQSEKFCLIFSMPLVVVWKYLLDLRDNQARGNFQTAIVKLSPSKDLLTKFRRWEARKEVNCPRIPSEWKFLHDKWRTSFCKNCFIALKEFQAMKSQRVGPGPYINLYTHVKNSFVKSATVCWNQDSAGE